MLPVGTERRTKSGYILVKVGSRKTSRGTAQIYHDNWVFKQRLVWERHHGKIPPGYQVIFLDANKENCDIGNLQCIPKAVATILSRNGWYTEDAELTKTAIKWCELYYAIKNAKGESI